MESLVIRERILGINNKFLLPLIITTVSFQHLGRKNFSTYYSLIAVTCNQNIAQSYQEGASCDLIDIIRNVLAGWSTFANDDVFVEKMDLVIAICT